MSPFERECWGRAKHAYLERVQAEFYIRLHSSECLNEARLSIDALCTRTLFIRIQAPDEYRAMRLCHVPDA